MLRCCTPLPHALCSRSRSRCCCDDARKREWLAQKHRSHLDRAGTHASAECIFCVCMCIFILFSVSTTKIHTCTRFSFVGYIVSTRAWSPMDDVARKVLVPAMRRAFVTRARAHTHRRRLLVNALIMYVHASFCTHTFCPARCTLKTTRIQHLHAANV